MFNKITSFVTTALVVSGVALAAPRSTNLEARAEQASPNIQVCTGAVGVGCITIPISSPSCISFTQGLSFLNKEVSSAVVPGGFVCTFFEQSGCLSAQGGADAVVLQGGSWNFITGVSGTASTVNFNDLSSSFICSPV
ncbi:hypothetical protein P691DRAFT_791116 [Macrolepiota fuliginosa MF-IS2]|uniref:Uncharacterized protein n=1 Tax=Macrolepiota fuliginosa MF-IS2 TaxID=1400762 RepID=A0A9P6BXC3_9AGAR|nr:hypothetical protein P691DRAFT_791116 [Macrolepiota fuliginosa MF-IS2]